MLSHLECFAFVRQISVTCTKERERYLNRGERNRQIRTASFCHSVGYANFHVQFKHWVECKHVYLLDFFVCLLPGLLSDFLKTFSPGLRKARTEKGILFYGKIQDKFLCEPGSAEPEVNSTYSH